MSINPHYFPDECKLDINPLNPEERITEAEGQQVTVHSCSLDACPHYLGQYECKLYGKIGT
jgi:hypothetical protein